MKHKIKTNLLSNNLFIDLMVLKLDNKSFRTSGDVNFVVVYFKNLA